MPHCWQSAGAGLLSLYNVSAADVSRDFVAVCVTQTWSKRSSD
jgi:hypothetical protein